MTAPGFLALFYSFLPCFVFVIADCGQGRISRSDEREREREREREILRKGMATVCRLSLVHWMGRHRPSPCDLTDLCSRNVVWWLCTIHNWQRKLNNDKKKLNYKAASTATSANNDDDDDDDDNRGRRETGLGVI